MLSDCDETEFERMTGNIGEECETENETFHSQSEEDIN